MTTGKIWGTTERVIATPLFEKHRLEIEPHRRCSIHRHHAKRNSFTVVAGELFIDVFAGGESAPAPGAAMDTTTLGPGDSTEVAAGTWHRFRTGGQRCVATEEYYPEALAEDIERFDHGGTAGPAGETAEV